MPTETALSAEAVFAPRQLLKTDSASLPEGRKGQRRGSMGRLRVLEMDNFIDTTNIEGRFEMSEYVRAYGKYLDEQLECFAATRFYQVGLRLLVVAACCALGSGSFCRSSQQRQSVHSGYLNWGNILLQARPGPCSVACAHVGHGMRLLSGYVLWEAGFGGRW